MPCVVLESLCEPGLKLVHTGHLLRTLSKERPRVLQQQTYVMEEIMDRSVLIRLQLLLHTSTHTYINQSTTFEQEKHVEESVNVHYNTSE